LTVKALREIAKRIGFRFISRYRKAELIGLISAEIDACHIEATREDKIRTRQSAPKISLMDYPVPYGRPVTEAHVKICRERGCVTYVKNGIDQGICPRCGEVTTTEEQITTEEIAETVSGGIVIAPVEIQIPAMLSEYGYSAHGNTYDVEYNRIHEEMQNRQAMANVRMSHSDPIDDVIRFANESINALMPTLNATKAAFESLRDDESANPNHVDLAYQVYADTHRAIEEYRRTIAYARS
jgi:hypothetical protein